MKYIKNINMLFFLFTLKMQLKDNIIILHNIHIKNNNI